MSTPMALTIIRNATGRPVGRLLEGEDDGAPFSVRVPLRCKTVEEALNWLRPDGAGADDPRQGDLWFVPEMPPLTDDGACHVERTPAGSETVTVCDGRTRWPVFGSRHVAEEACIIRRYGWTKFIGRRGRVREHRWEARPVAYVRGLIEHPEHGTLVLDGWHRVVPNRASQVSLDGGLRGGD